MPGDLKKRTFEIVEMASAGDVISRLFDMCIVSLITLNAIAVIFETVQNLFSECPLFFQVFETFSVIVFTIEYGIRLWACTADERFQSPVRGRLRFALTPLALVDLIAIVPFYLPVVFALDLRFVRILRLFRIFRLLKMGRYIESLHLFGSVFREKKEELLMGVFIVAILLVFASSSMYALEHAAQPDIFSSIPASMWWGVATLTTVGYGDVYPITPVGKVLGAIIALLGIGLFALPAGILASGFAEAMQRGRSPHMICPHCGKVIEH